MSFVRLLVPEFRLYLCNHWVTNVPSHHFRLWFYRTVMDFKIGKNSSIFMGATFDCAGGFRLGENTTLNSNCRMDPRGGIEIGSNASISNEVIILTADHDMDSPDFVGRTRSVKIDDYAWIGTRAMILPGVTIGRGAVVAAGAVVTKSVEPFSVVAGLPARPVRSRGQDLRYNATYRRLFQ